MRPVWSPSPSGKTCQVITVLQQTQWPVVDQGRLDRAGHRRDAIGKTLLGLAHSATGPAGSASRRATTASPTSSTNSPWPRADGSHPLGSSSASQDRAPGPRRLGTRFLASQERHDLLEVLDDRYARRGTVLASHLPVEHWHDIVADAAFGDAILDRSSTAATASPSGAAPSRGSATQPRRPDTLTTTPDPSMPGIPSRITVEPGRLGSESVGSLARLR